MKHLTDDQLSARLDRALTGRALEEAERHLTGCARCRDALAALAAQDRFLGAALAHDPGTEYFATFAARVEDRLRADGIRGAQARLRDDQAPWLRWFHAPRRVAWMGAVATIVAGAAIVIVTTREDRMPRLRAPELATRVPEIASAPPETETSPTDVVGTAPNDAAKQRVDASAGIASRRAQDRDALNQAPGPARLEEGAGAAPARMRPVGSAEPVVPEPQMARQSAPVAPAPEGKGVRVMKRNYAQPLEKDENLAANEKQVADARAQETAPAPAMLQSSPPAADKEKASGAPPSASGFAAPPLAASDRAGARPGEVQLCGKVLDTAGRPVAGASVALVTIGRTATTSEAGGFCMSAPGGSYELSVMAVGFAGARMQVKVAGERSDVRVTMQAISVLDGMATHVQAGRLEGGEPMKLNSTTSGAKTETKTDAKKPASPTSTTTVPAKPKVQPKDPFAGESKTGAAAAAQAMAATRYASTYPTLPTWQKAKVQWSTAAEAVKTPSGRAEALYRIAEAKVNEWRQLPGPTRKNDALASCSTALSGTPTPERRKDIIRWMSEVRRGPTGRD